MWSIPACTTASKNRSSTESPHAPSNGASSMLPKFTPRPSPAAAVGRASISAGLCACGDADRCPAAAVTINATAANAACTSDRFEHITFERITRLLIPGDSIDERPSIASAYHAADCVHVMES